MTLKLAEGIADATTTAAPKSTAATRGQGVGAFILRRVVPPVLLLVAGVLLVEILVAAFEIPPFVLASPSAIAAQFAEYLPAVLAATIVTGLNALIGLIIGSVIAVVLAVLASFAKSIDGMLAPVVAAVAVVPIVALAPVLYTMFGSTSEVARILIASLAVFVPVFLNTLRGLRQVRPVHRDLLRAYAATRWQETRAITIPSAVPHFFTGLRIGASLAVISALVAEYFGGPREGLGSAITTAASSSAYARAWAFVIGAILLGLIAYIVTTLLERIVSRHR